MPDQPASEIKLLRAAYTAFNARDIDAAFATMTADVAWPKALRAVLSVGPKKCALTGRASGEWLILTLTPYVLRRMPVVALSLMFTNESVT